MESVIKTTRDYVGDLVHKRFNQFKMLEDFLACVLLSSRSSFASKAHLVTCRDFIGKTFDRCASTSKDEIRKVLLEPQMKRPHWTQNNYYYTTVRDQWKAKYDHECAQRGQWESEIVVMSSVRAYFQVAYKVRSDRRRSCLLILTSAGCASSESFFLAANFRRRPARYGISIQRRVLGGTLGRLVERDQEKDS
jgi:hypothetical protein